MIIQRVWIYLQILGYTTHANLVLVRKLSLCGNSSTNVINTRLNLLTVCAIIFLVLRLSHNPVRKMLKNGRHHIKMSLYYMKGVPTFSPMDLSFENFIKHNNVLPMLPNLI